MRLLLHERTNTCFHRRLTCALTLRNVFAFRARITKRSAVNSVVYRLSTVIHKSDSNERAGPHLTKVPPTTPFPRESYAKGPLGRNRRLNPKPIHRRSFPFSQPSQPWFYFVPVFVRLLFATACRSANRARPQEWNQPRKPGTTRRGAFCLHLATRLTKFIANCVLNAELFPWLGYRTP